jgi:hypothetical protein
MLMEKSGKKLNAQNIIIEIITIDPLKNSFPRKEVLFFIHFQHNMITCFMEKVFLDFV